MKITLTFPDNSKLRTDDVKRASAVFALAPLGTVCQAGALSAERQPAGAVHVDAEYAALALRRIALAASRRAERAMGQLQARAHLA